MPLVSDAKNCFTFIRSPPQLIWLILPYSTPHLGWSWEYQLIQMLDCCWLFPYVCLCVLSLCHCFRFGCWRCFIYLFILSLTQQLNNCYFNYKPGISSAPPSPIGFGLSQSLFTQKNLFTLFFIPHFHLLYVCGWFLKKENICFLHFIPDII